MQPGVGEVAHEVVHPEPARAHRLDQARARQLRQRARRLLLVRREQRRRRGRAQRGPSAQREPAQQPAGVLVLVEVAQPQGPLDRAALPGGGQLRGQRPRGARAQRGTRHAQRQRQSSAQLPHIVEEMGVAECAVVLLGRRSQQLPRPRPIQRADLQLVGPGHQVRWEGERGGGRDQHQALGALGHERADLLRVGGVVEHDRDRQPRQVLVVDLRQPLEVLVL
ncbi:hypothetical protein GCM10020221_09600 [Streptomyces thioluteus]|uniref:Uncharacterized protein n=1 Tax=Streptomyces thioluteus TaxID=66431 RepID=A0ABN3WIN2_STRTU